MPKPKFPVFEKLRFFSSLSLTLSPLSKISSALSPRTVTWTAIFSFLLMPKLLTVQRALEGTGFWPVRSSSTLVALVSLSPDQPTLILRTNFSIFISFIGFYFSSCFPINQWIQINIIFHILLYQHLYRAHSFHLSEAASIHLRAHSLQMRYAPLIILIMPVRLPEYRRNYLIGNRQLKQRSRQSFELKLEDAHQFDTFIAQKYARMVADKTENPSLIIPMGFKAFVNSKLFKELLRTIQEYMRMLNCYESQFKKINNQVGHIKGIKTMQSEGQKLQRKCQQISYAYMGILLGYGSSRLSNDQYFFQTMIYFISEVLKESFGEEQFPLINQELNRIFRTDTFNLIKRRHQEDQMIKQYPILKETKYEPSPSGDICIMNKIRLRHRLHCSVSIKLQRKPGISKPVETKRTSFQSILGRSPLISSLLPNYRQKLNEYIKTSRESRDSIVICKKRSHSFQSRRRSYEKRSASNMSFSE